MSDERKKKIIKFTLFIIIIIIILMLYSCVGIGKINDFVPTGNIDIFDINIDNSCCNDIKPCECNCEVCDNDEPNKKNNTRKVNGEIEKEEEIKNARILDGDGKYNNSTKLNIFSNPAYEFRSVIAPTSSNVYQFVVRNNNDFSIKYELITDEENEYNINMKYKLKMDGNYIVGNQDNWVTYEDIKVFDVELVSNSKNVYQLEWKWFESPNDTYVGEVGKDYSLKISFDGVEI